MIACVEAEVFPGYFQENKYNGKVVPFHWRFKHELFGAECVLYLQEPFYSAGGGKANLFQLVCPI